MAWSLLKPRQLRATDEPLSLQHLWFCLDKVAKGPLQITWGQAFITVHFTVQINFVPFTPLCGTSWRPTPFSWETDEKERNRKGKGTARLKSHCWVWIPCSPGDGGISSRAPPGHEPSAAVTWPILLWRPWGLSPCSCSSVKLKYSLVFTNCQYGGSILFL